MSLLTKTGRKSIPFSRWKDKWEGKLERLDNGFVIFLPEMFSMENISIP